MYIKIILITLLIVFILLQQLYPRTKHLSIGFICLFIIISLFIIVFRPSSMPDYINYKDLYNHLALDEYRYEPTAFLFRSISPSFLFFLMCFALVSISFKLKAINSISPYPLLSLVCFLSTYFVFHDMIQIRLSCAIGIFLFSLKYLIEGNRIKYLLCIAIATLFQYSSIIFAVFIFLKNKSLNIKLWVIIILLSLIGVLKVLSLLFFVFVIF